LKLDIPTSAVKTAATPAATSTPAPAVKTAATPAATVTPVAKPADTPVATPAPTLTTPAPTVKSAGGSGTNVTAAPKGDTEATSSGTAVGDRTRIVTKESKSFFDTETVIRAPATGGHSERIPPKAKIDQPVPYETDEKTVGHQTAVNYPVPAREPSEQTEISFHTDPGIRAKRAEKVSGAEQTERRSGLRRKIRSNEWALIIAALFIVYLVYHESNRRPATRDKIDVSSEVSTKDRFLSDMLSAMQQTKNGGN
ncbi:MAG: hypothetical protein ABL958_05945, partial [Bdellovibrionia bacterium]